MSEVMTVGEAIILISVGLLGLWFVLWIYILLPARMARERGRSEVGWVILGLISSPFLAILLLLLLGRSAAGDP